MMDETTTSSYQSGGEYESGDHPGEFDSGSQPFDSGDASQQPGPGGSGAARFEGDIKVEKHEVDLTEEGEEEGSLEATLDHVAEYEGAYGGEGIPPLSAEHLAMMQPGGMGMQQPGPSYRGGADDGSGQGGSQLCGCEVGHVATLAQSVPAGNCHFATC